MTEQMKAATIRAFYGGLFVAALVFLTKLQTTPVLNAETIARAGIEFGVALVGYMVARGIAEGLIDSNRAASGNVTPADVGQPQPR